MNESSACWNRAAPHRAEMGQSYAAGEAWMCFVRAPPWRLFGPSSGGLGFFALAAPAPFLWRQAWSAGTGGRRCWWKASVSCCPPCWGRYRHAAEPGGDGRWWAARRAPGRTTKGGTRGPAHG